MEHNHMHTSDMAHMNSAHEHHGTNPHQGHDHMGHDHSSMIADFRKRFFVVGGLTIPIMLLSPMIQHWLNIHLQFTGSNYLLFALSTIVFLYGGYPFLKGLVSEIRSKNPGMMTLIAVAITVAFVYSTAITFGLKGMDFFWELTTLILIMLLGHWIEMKSIAGASHELELLVQLMPSDAHLVHDTHVMEVKTDSLKVGDIILIKPGEKVAADGLIIDGESSLNESMLTGESKPVLKSKGEKVIAGSINGNGALKVTVTHGAKDSYLAQVIQLVNDAQQSKSNTQLLADTAAKWLTIVALLSGAITFIVWYFIVGKDLAFAMERMVTVIVICCPHALGLAVPLVVAKSTALSAKHGLLIKNRTAFENARKITTLVFDKTGTLTIGKFLVTRIQSFNSALSESKILQLASALEQNSEHPIATGILQKIKEGQVPVLQASNFKAITGTGVEATVDGQTIMVVSPRYIKETFPQFTFPETDIAETVVYVIAGNEVAGFIALADKIRDESADAIATLQANHIKAILLTGDNKQVAESVSTKLGMDGYFAEVLPHQKLEKIKELQGKGEFVAMTGDGVNDAPALAQADIGIAVGSGSDIAAETAGIVLVNSNPKDIVSLILFGKATYRKMIQNLIWATGYNVIALPLAAGVLYKQGIMLSPAMGAVLMTLSTIVVAINAQLLNRTIKNGVHS
jgi:Cu2+-exporting ATPase